MKEKPKQTIIYTVDECRILWVTVFSATGKQIFRQRVSASDAFEHSKKMVLFLYMNAKESHE